MSYSLQELMYEHAVFSSKAKLSENLRNKKLQEEDQKERDEADDFARQMGFDLDEFEEVDKPSKPNSKEATKEKELSKDDEAWMHKMMKEEGIEFPDEMNVSF